MTPDSLSRLDALIEAARLSAPWQIQDGPSLVAAFGPFHRSIEDEAESALWTRLGDCLQGNAEGSFDAAITFQKIALIEWIWGRNVNGAMWLARGKVKFTARPMMAPHRGLMLVCLQALRHERARAAA